MSEGRANPASRVSTRRVTNRPLHLSPSSEHSPRTHQILNLRLRPPVTLPRKKKTLLHTSNLVEFGLLLLLSWLLFASPKKNSLPFGNAPLALSLLPPSKSPPIHLPTFHTFHTFPPSAIKPPTHIHSTSPPNKFFPPPSHSHAHLAGPSHPASPSSSPASHRQAKGTLIYTVPSDNLVTLSCTTIFCIPPPPSCLHSYPLPCTSSTITSHRCPPQPCRVFQTLRRPPARDNTHTPIQLDCRLTVDSFASLQTLFPNVLLSTGPPF